MRISDWSSDVCSSDLPGGYRRWPGQCAGSLHRPAGRQEFRQAYRPGRGPLSHCPVRADDSRDKKEMTMTTNSSPALQGSILVSGVGSLQGVGAAIARRFGREGYPVLIAGRSGDKLQATAELPEPAGITIEAVSGAVATPEGRKSAVRGNT